MKKNLSTVAILLVLLLVACSPGGGVQQPAGANSGEPATATRNASLPALDTAVPSPMPEPLEKTTPEADTRPPESDDMSNVTQPSEGDTQVITPVEVNLSDLTPAPTVISEPVEMPNPGRPGSQQQAVVADVIQDLAERLDIEPEEITLVSAEVVDWPDGGLGCPAPGMSYITAITPGYKIVLTAGGEEYTYHSDLRGNFVLCGADGIPVP